MLSPVSETIWSLLPQRLMDIRMPLGQLGANRLLAQTHSSLTTLLLPYSANQSRSVELLNCFTLNEFAMSLGKPLEIIVADKDAQLKQAIETFSKYFQTEVMSEVLCSKTLLSAADKVKPRLLAKSNITLPYSRHLELLAYLLKRLNADSKQKLLLLVYESDLELIYLLSKSLPKALNERIGTIVLAKPQTDALLLGSPDDKSAFKKALSRLPSGNENEQDQKITNCEVYQLLFQYDEHHPDSFSAKTLDNCLSGATGCQSCKSQCSDYLTEKYLNTITASESP